MNGGIELAVLLNHNLARDLWPRAGVVEIFEFMLEQRIRAAIVIVGGRVLKSHRGSDRLEAEQAEWGGVPRVSIAFYAPPMRGIFLVIARRREQHRNDHRRRASSLECVGRMRRGLGACLECSDIQQNRHRECEC